jgi:hypothetical protein
MIDREGIEVPSQSMIALPRVGITPRRRSSAVALAG